ncbi:MAG: hypothetical protein AAFM92_14470 [Pseudomonadota bacterium]
MLKPFAALLLSGVIAVTSLSPTPARAADGEDLAALLFGALILYGIAEAAKDDRRKKAATATRQVRPQPNLAKRLPKHCIRATAAHGRGGPPQFFGYRCLRTSFPHYAKLPEQCFRRFATAQGPRPGFGPRCLRRAGFVW